MKVNLGSMEVLENLLEFLGSGGGDEEQVGQVLLDLYDNKVKNYRPLLKALGGVLGKTGEDLAPVATALFKLVNNLLENGDLNLELERLTRGKAKRRQASLKIYMKAGFRRQEAMAFLLKDEVNRDSLLDGLKNVKVGKSSS